MELVFSFENVSKAHFSGWPTYVFNEVGLEQFAEKDAEEEPKEATTEDNVHLGTRIWYCNEKHQ